MAFKKRQAKGFTLIEMMLVVVIIGIAASLVSLSVGDGNQGLLLKQDSQKLYKTMQLALSEAAFSQKQIGLRFDVANQSGQLRYQWLVFDDKARRWNGFATEDLTQTTLPETLGVELEIDKQAVIIGAKKDEDGLFDIADSINEEKRIEPDIYFLSSGEMPDFTLRLFVANNPDSAYQITGDLVGRLQFLTPGEKTNAAQP